MFIFFLFVIFVLVVVISIFEEDDEDYMKKMYYGVIFVLTLIVAFRPIGIDRDSLTYIDYYDMVDVGVVELVEPSFHLINSIAHFFDSPRFIFVIYALLALPLKGYAVSKMSGCWFLSLAIWLNNYFILHECTQIRTAVVGAIFLYALSYLVDRKRLVFLGFIFLSVFFHFSALLLIPLVLFGTNPINRPWRFFLTCAPVFCYATHSAGIDPFTLIPFPFFQEKMELYETIRDSGTVEALNVYNMMALFRLGSYYFILWKCNEIYKSCPNIYLYLKIMCFSICLYAFFAFTPEIGVRSSELYGVIDILILPTMIYAVKPEWVVRMVLGVVCFGLFFMNVFVNEYLTFDI